MSNHIFWVMWLAVQLLIAYNLFLPVLLYLFAGLRKKRLENQSPASTERDFGIIVTAYEQTEMLPAVIESILQSDYQNYLIYVVADKCDISNLKFSSSKVVILRPEETLASNTRSHFYAINHFKRSHSHLTIIDSDNLVDPNYLKEINTCFEQGFLAVQGVREAKNLDTTYSCLDAARDIYYHFYDGKVLFRTGSSATLAGSGMAFTTQLYKECLEKLDIKGAGFDKVLQYEIVRRGHTIAFAEKAIVYDEKTSRPEQLVKQRSRWINTWFKYFSFGFSLTALGIKRASLNQFLFGLILLRPPLFIFILIGLFFLVVNIFTAPVLALAWGISFLLFVTGFIISLLRSDTDKRIYSSLAGIPSFMFLQVISLFKARKANEISVATKHYSHVKQ